MRFVTISCSLDPDSRSWLLAGMADAALRAADHEATLIDLRTLALPLFDNAAAFGHPSYALLHDASAAADGVVIAAPVYNWGLGSGVKALIELTGAHDGAHRRSAWFDKLVTFVCAGGLPHSYMAYLPVANGLMLDFNCILNPYVVYATDRDWTVEGQADAALRTRLTRSFAVKMELAAGLQARRYRSDWEI